jgi:phosphoglycerate dehydrogenase-like enzyme
MSPPSVADSDPPDDSPPKVTVLSNDDSDPPGIDRLAEHAKVALAWDEASLRDALPGTRVLLVTDFRTQALEAAWPAADALRWVHTTSAGVNHVLFDALIHSDVVLTNARGFFDRSIAEYVLGVILMFAKDSRNNIVYQQQRRWVHRETETILDKRVLVVGAGSIGREIGALCRDVGMRVTGIARHAREDDDVFEVIHPAEAIDAHLGDADYVVIATPLTAATEGWFNAERFVAMKNQARLINIGRGAIVVTQDLIAALDNHEIVGAALDVFEQEPLPAKHPL